MSLGFPFLPTVVFIALSVFAFYCDYQAHKDDKPITLKSAVFWSLFYIGISVLYGVFLWFNQGSQIASLFFTGYALEKVLSVDNLFVIMAIFSWFKIPDGLRHRVLYWGIMGAIVFRLIFVIIGAALLSIGAFVEAIFALVILYAAYKMLKSGGDDGNDDEEMDYANHPANKFVHKFFPVFPRLVGNKFFLTPAELEQAKLDNPDVVLEKSEIEKDIEEKTHTDVTAQPLKEKVNFFKNPKLWIEETFESKFGKYVATPLFICLCIIELSDVMFAFDSVPAVIAVSKEPLIVYSAMMFAILGLRSLYFVLEALKSMLVHLEKAVVILLFFIGFKLLFASTKHMFGIGFEIPATTSLIIVLTVLVGGVVSSLIANKMNKNKTQ